MASEDSQMSEKDIEEAIDNYLKNVPPLFKKFISGPPPKEENYKFNRFGQGPYLLITKFDLTKLPIKILKRLPIYLIKEFVVQVELDSLWYWALTHDVVESNKDRVFQQQSLGQAFSVLMAAHFAQLGKPPITPEIYQLNRIINEVVLEPVKQLVLHSDIIATYICYPVLEGLIKIALTPLVDYSGEVVKTFSDGKNLYKPSKRVSSLATLLRALEVNAQKVLSKPDLSVNLRDFRLQLEKTILPPKGKLDGWDEIYKLRNILLHREIGWQLRSGFITNLICLIIWHLIDEQTLEQELQKISMRLKSFFRFPTQYYPPEL